MKDFKDIIIEQQNHIIEQQNHLIEELRERIDVLTKRIEQLEEENKFLKEQLNKNSSNSSKPPSSDGLKKKPVNKNRSFREKSDKNPGGQYGHEGKYLTVLSNPERREKHLHSDCVNCPKREECLKNASVKETRNVIDIVVDVNVVAHEQIVISQCPICGQAKTGEFPASTKAYVQYGDNLEAFVVALNTVGAVSINRTHEILGGVFNIPISTGTIKNMVSRCAEKVSPALDIIKEKLINSEINHADETGIRVDGKLHWVHSVSNDKYTYMDLHKKRGLDAIKDIGILPEFNGILVHDCWSPYWKLEVLGHQLCCAHLLRELNGIQENDSKQTWAAKFKTLLLKMKSAKEKALKFNKETLSKSTLQRYSAQYDEIIQLAYQENPEPDSSKTKRGNIKRGKVLSLIDRLFQHKGEVCLFLNDLSVPFDNNQAERDIRNVKVKTKVSGCFRTADGALEYLKIMSFISTAKKLGFLTFQAVKFVVIHSPNSIFV